MFLTMEDSAKKILFVNSEMSPYLPDTDIATLCRQLPQGIQERKKEIRAFMPRYGCINERKNQLHEVIRLSGMNIIISDVDRPLVIKVASIASARIQVYFIDNEDYFKRKFVHTDERGKFFQDNDERAILFARGTLETVKKLRWQPKIVHCIGWMSHLVPMYLKKEFKTDPIFATSSVLVTLYNEFTKEKFSPAFAKKIIAPPIKPSDVELLNTPNGTNLAKLAVQYADGVVIGSKELPKEISDFAAKKKIPQLVCADVSAKNTAAYTAKYLKFYSKFI